jgi:hypothetical protein
LFRRSPATAISFSCEQPTLHSGLQLLQTGRGKIAPSEIVDPVMNPAGISAAAPHGVSGMLAQLTKLLPQSARPSRRPRIRMHKPALQI